MTAIEFIVAALAFLGAVVLCIIVVAMLFNMIPEKVNQNMVTVRLWYFDALGCRIEAGTVKVLERRFSEREVRDRLKAKFAGSGRRIYFKVRSDQ